MRTWFIAQILLLSFSFLLSHAASASIQLPQMLTHNDRITALQIIGLGTSAKILTDPYPLGGYAGFEAGFSVENLPAEDLGHLGKGLTQPQQDVTLSQVSLGKGLYNNIDVFFQFTPYTKNDEIAQYGGLARWGFYQATSIPMSVSSVFHVNSATISNQLSTHTYGADLIGGFNVEHMGLFAGIGISEASGTFVGGAAGVTDSAQLESEVVDSLHTVIGADIHLSSFFISLQIDRYMLPVFSGKLGARF